MQTTNREESWVHAYDVPFSLQFSVLLVYSHLLSLVVCVLSVFLMKIRHFALKLCDFFHPILLHNHRLCLGAWSEHGKTTTGGYYACNRYEAAKKEGIVCSLLDIILLCIEEEAHSWVACYWHATHSLVP